MLRAILPRASQRTGSTEKKKGATTGNGFVMLDDYTIDMSDNLSGVFMPVTQSVDMSAITQSADLCDYNNLVRVLHDGSNMSEDLVQSFYEYKANITNLSDSIYVSQLLLGKSEHVFAARTSSTKNKFKGRQGIKAVKTLERLESTAQILTPEKATTYRALSARADYLAQDKPDAAFSTKRLC